MSGIILEPWATAKIRREFETHILLGMKNNKQVNETSNFR